MTRLSRWLESPWVAPAGLFLLALVILRWTLVPTLYTFDSAELATAAYTLGLPHAPGYPLYMLLAHGFLQLPLGLDIAGRANLFSALCLAGAVVGLYALLLRLFGERWLALGTALVWLASYYVWSAGIVAEVYAAQALTLAWTGWALAALPQKTWRGALIGGALYGLALGVHPGSVLFAPAVALAYVLAGVRPVRCVGAGLICALIFGMALLYFPLRYSAGASFSLLGEYNAAGQFVPVDLTTPSGILWVLRGAQFDKLFFGGGSLVDGLARLIGWLLANFLGLGVLVGVAGVWALRHRLRLLLVWLVAVVPFILFYATYGAPDVETMLLPLYLLWMLVFAAGWQWFSAAVGRQATFALFLYAAALLVVNFPLVDGSRDDSVRRRATYLMEALPPESVVFGGWFDVVPLEYQQIVEGARPDVRLMNLFLFEEPALEAYLETLWINGGECRGEACLAPTMRNRPIVILGARESVERLPLPVGRLQALTMDAPLDDIEALRLEAYRLVNQP
ncbi:MAG: DUF2723 domain-containing protein [bacterium]|nr:DUF2723 domain-containing protein [bacterium]